jgi:hypothetical protein
MKSAIYRALGLLSGLFAMCHYPLPRNPRVGNAPGPSPWVRSHKLECARRVRHAEKSVHPCWLPSNPIRVEWES